MVVSVQNQKSWLLISKLKEKEGFVLSSLNNQDKLRSLHSTSQKNIVFFFFKWQITRYKTWYSLDTAKQLPTAECWQTKPLANYSPIPGLICSMNSLPNLIPLATWTNHQYNETLFQLTTHTTEIVTCFTKTFLALDTLLPKETKNSDHLCICEILTMHKIIN